MQNNLENTSGKVFWKRIILSMIFPLFFIILLWIIRFVEYEFEISFSSLGIYPLNLKGVPGIILSPLIHMDAAHLFNNSIPLLILGSSIFYFYSDVAFRVIALGWVLTGIMVWITGRESWHIGASGLVYSFAFFLFVSGLIRKYFRLLALSMLVVYLYGSMVWGMFPFVQLHVSWEAHMMGAFSGIILAFWFRNEGPQKPPEPEWLQNDDENEFENKYWINEEN
jgi:membrane associated rhomboid family serine protease